jgi:hypothetical protein
MNPQTVEFPETRVIGVEVRTSHAHEASAATTRIGGL